MHRAERSRTRSLALLALLTAAAAAQDQPHTADRAITGRVVDENGKPIAGAAVGAFAARDFVDTSKLLAKPQAVTAADGSYAITASDEQRYGVLVLAVAGRQSCALQITDAMVTDGGAVGDTLLVPGAKLIGRVRDEAGAPLAGVRIRVESSIGDNFSFQVRLVAGAVSDPKGIYTVPCVPRSGLHLTAEADGYLAESRLVAQETPIDLSLRKVGMVRGKVVDASGAPLAGIEVYGVTVESRDAYQPTISAADGTFAITVPKAGRFRVGGFERAAPHREFSSGLLHGPADDVVLTDPQGAAANARTIEVIVVDAATKVAIPKFHLSQQQLDPTNLQLAMFYHGTQRRPYEGKARLQLAPVRQNGWPRQQAIVVVDAPDHGFEVVPVPDELDKPLEVALGLEAVLTGRVFDAETNKPLAGVAVRALPTGGSSGSGSSVEAAGPLTDAQGYYRVTRLRPGTYGVQAHAAGHPASAVASVTLVAGGDNKLDLSVPKQRWIEIELTGTIPAGPACRLSLGGNVRRGGHQTGNFEHSIPQPEPLAVTKAGAFKFGPVGNGAWLLQLFVPSRTRTGTGTTIQLGEIDPTGGPTTIALPDLTTKTAAGRVELPPHVPSERIAVLATLAAGKQQAPRSGERPNVAGIDADGRFHIDLPAGSYCLQLVDLSTGIVFHTEEQDLTIDANTGAITIRPRIHWLEIECAPRQVGAEVVLQSFGVSLHRPRNGACSAFLRMGGRSNDIDSNGVDFHIGAATQRWLVPEGEIAIKAWQTFEILKPWARGYQGVEVDSARLDIDKPEQRVTLKIPPPPSDEQLLRRQ